MLEGRICEFRFDGFGNDTRLELGRIAGMLHIRVTTKGETSRWGWVPDEDMLYAIWAGEYQSRYWHEHQEGEDRVLLNVARGVILDGELVEYDDGDQLAFSVLLNRDNNNVRHLQVDRATTGRKLYEAFRKADTLQIELDDAGNGHCHGNG